MTIDKKDYLEFLIYPEKEVTKKEKEHITQTVELIESYGLKVYFPLRDTNQKDLTGLNIYSQHREVIRKADAVRLYYNPTSQEIVFNLGMTFMLNKNLFIINSEAIEKRLTPLEQLIFNYILRGTSTAEKYPIYPAYHQMLVRRNVIKLARQIEYEWKNNNWEFLFDFGMSFMEEKPIRLLNRAEVEKKRTNEKSFQNMLLELDSMYT
ncbi:hypothetical protein AYK26_05240 [Euryarchaeota archaeon SM23-78]|nr:MAG: hypothetical protein AYK26_05240 [Euryarchaeota archaeon SM23-78]MBW3001148.1 hypothetical protein [Candidatus Woesearchaeota archaeon]